MLRSDLPSADQPEGFQSITPNEMETSLNNSNVLPALSTKKDLEALATTDDLRIEIIALRNELRPILEALRGDIQVLAEQIYRFTDWIQRER